MRTRVIAREVPKCSSYLGAPVSCAFTRSVGVERSGRIFVCFVGLCCAAPFLLVLAFRASGAARRFGSAIDDADPIGES